MHPSSNEDFAMPAMHPPRPVARPLDCNCLVVRQAARHVTQLYDRWLAPFDLRTSQFGVLARLRREGPMSINALAASLVMDRTTVGRNVRPLQRDGLVAVTVSPADRRSRELRLTDKGTKLLERSLAGWAEAQASFERSFGKARAAAFRALLKSVVATEFRAGED
jgi:DNA-binding MarR family transcriptional regulator